jgi:signal peptidase I
MQETSSSSPSQEPSDEGRPRNSLFREAWDLAKVLVVGGLIVFLVRTYIAQPFFVRGGSMDPSFYDGEYLIVEELSYRTGLRDPARGDVIVFRYPLNPSQHYIKRIIALPGERVRIDGGTVTVFRAEFPQGVRLDEGQYLAAAEETNGTVDTTLGPDEYFVLGDNREHSSDSRAWGPVARKLVVGRAWVRVFPVARAGALSAPQYGGLVPPAETRAPVAAPSP